MSEVMNNEDLKLKVKFESKYSSSRYTFTKGKKKR